MPVRIANSIARQAAPHLNLRDIAGRFAGVRPLVAGWATPAAAFSREYALERHAQMLTVFGGKSTTARALGRKAAALLASRG